MARLATMLALLIALAAGCGDSGNDKSDSPSPSAAAKTPQSSSGAEKPKDSAKKPPKADKSKPAADDEAKKPSGRTDEADASAPKTEQDIADAEAEAYKKLSAKRQMIFARLAAQGVLSRFGMELASVELANDGTDVTVFVTRATACRAVASQEPNMRVAMNEALPAAKNVRFIVAGTGKELGYYVINCKRPKIPNGKGVTVLEHTGVRGPWTSKPFVIKTKHWALEWVNESASMAGIVVGKGRNKGKYFKPIGSQKSESGRYEYVGSGKFVLKVDGAGRWTVRVKEIR